MKKKIFLTGGSGVLGQNCLNCLSNQYEILSPTRKELELSNASSVASYMKSSRWYAIIHAANVGGTRVSPKPDSDYFYENLKTFYNVFDQRKLAKKFIQLGSGAEYGRPLSYPKITEEQLGKKIPCDGYGFSKLICAQLLKQLSPKEAVNLNIFSLCAPGENYKIRFISNAITRALCGLPIVIKQDIKFNYLFIEDFIKILVQFIEKDASFSHYNLGSPNYLFLSEIAEIIRDILGTNTTIEVEKPAPDYEYTCSIERLKEFLGPNFFFTPFKESIEKMITFYHSQIEKHKLSYIENLY